MLFDELIDILLRIIVNKGVSRKLNHNLKMQRFEYLLGIANKIISYLGIKSCGLHPACPVRIVFMVALGQITARK